MAKSSAERSKEYRARSKDNPEKKRINRERGKANRDKLKRSRQMGKKEKIRKQVRVRVEKCRAKKFAGEVAKNAALMVSPKLNPIIYATKGSETRAINR
jgi:hypothetical protein